MTPLFTNWANITSQEDSVQLSFGYTPGGTQAVPVAILAVTPSYLKMLQTAINTAVEKHERTFGPISEGSIVMPNRQFKVPVN